MKVCLQGREDANKVHELFFATLKSLGIDLRIDPNLGLVGVSPEHHETVQNIVEQLNDQVEGRFAEVGYSAEDHERLVTMAKMRAMVEDLKFLVGPEKAYQLVVTAAKAAAKACGKPGFENIPNTLAEFKAWRKAEENKENLFGSSLEDAVEGRDEVHGRN